MHTHSFQRHLLSEGRLCKMSFPASNTEAFRNKLDKVNTQIDNFLQGRFDTLIQGDKITQQNMADERQWLQAFREPDIFAAVRTTTPLKHPFKPLDFLKTLTPQERYLEFVRFARSMIPENIRHSKPHVFRDPLITSGLEELFTTTDLDGYVAGKGGISSLPDTIINPILDAQALILGSNIAKPSIGGSTAAAATAGIVPGIGSSIAAAAAGGVIAGPGRALEVAQATLQEIYPPAKLGNLSADYETAVRFLSAHLPPPTSEQLRSPTYLLDNLPESRLKGYLRTTHLAEAKAKIGILADNHDAHQLALNSQRDQSHLALNEMNKEFTVQAQRQFRTMEQMYDRLSPTTQLLLCAAGVGTLIQALRGKSFFWKAMRLPIGAMIGYMSYQYFYEGNENARSDMLKIVQNIGRGAGSAVGKTFRGAGIVGPENTEKLLAEMNLMHRFVDEHAFLEAHPTVASMLPLAEAKLSSIALAFAPKIDNNGAKTFGGVLYAPPGHPLYTEVQGIIKNRNYDKGIVENALYKNNEKISEALSVFFYLLASGLPENASAARAVEQARRTDGGPRGSYESIQDPTARAHFGRMMEQGKLMAMESSALRNLTLSQALGAITTPPEDDPSKIDTAQRIKGDIFSLPHRQNEGRLFALRRETLNPSLSAERSETINRGRKDFDSFLDFCETRGPNHIIDANARSVIVSLADDFVRADESAPITLQSFEKLKHLILIAALAKNPLPLAQEDIELQIIPKSKKPSGILEEAADLSGNILRGINRNVLTVSGAALNVSTIGDVQAMLKERFFTFGNAVKSLDKRGFPLLDTDLQKYKEQFETMQNQERVSTRFRDSLDTASITRLGGPKAAAAEIEKILAYDKAPHKEHTNRAEQIFAQKAAIGLLTAMLLNHSADGEHTTDILQDQRSVTPNEERNLQDEWRKLFNEIAGSGRHPGDGAWGRIELASTAKKLTESIDPLNIHDVSNDANGQQALQNSAEIARTYLLILESQKSAPALPPSFLLLRVELAKRLEAIAKKFTEIWNKQNSDDDRRNLKIKNKSWKELDVLLTSMNIVGVGLTPSTGSLALTTGLAVLPATTPGLTLRQQIEEIKNFK